MARGETRASLEALGVRPKRQRGQSFLHDRGIARRIVDVAEVEGADVLEIGPGLGALTDDLAARARRLVAVEVDPPLAAALRERFAEHPTVTIVEGDALEVDLAAVAPGAPCRVVANLPYSLTSPLLFRLYEQAAVFERLVVMVQLEVAQRLVATPSTKAYGAPTVWTSLYGRARILFRVSPAAFVPRPRVASAVVEMRRHESPPVEVLDEAWLRRVVRASFGQRRKTLRRALTGLVAEPAFAAAGIDSGRRGETLTLEEFARLADASLAGAP